MERIPMLPSEEDISRSVRMRGDSYYKLPREVENFRQHFNRENEGRAYVRTWTLLRHVVLVRKDKVELVVTYEMIFDNIVECLNVGKTFAGMIK